jgi:hypothetical protein
MVHFRLEFMLTILIYGENHTYCSSKLSFLFASKEIGLEVNPDQSKCQFVSRDQNTG